MNKQQFIAMRREQLTTITIGVRINRTTGAATGIKFLSHTS